MVTSARDASSASGAVNLAADDISQYGYKTSNELYSIGRREAEVFQLQSARRRFEELAPKITALKEQADQHGTHLIETLDDLVPLLYNHTVFKSYPISLLEKNRFDLLTRWFKRLTPLDLSGIDASKCEGIDEWMTLLESKAPLKIYHTSGTSGKLSFLRRSSTSWGCRRASGISGIHFRGRRMRPVRSYDCR
jgi:hypothetical protein